MPRNGLDRSAVGDLAYSTAPELADDLDILSIVEAERALLVVLKLRVVDALLRNGEAAPHKDTLNLEVWLLAGHAHTSKGILVKLLKALQEALEKVFSLVHDLAFALVLFILQEPHGPALLVELLDEFIDTAVGLVGVVHEKCLEVVEIKLRLWQQIKWVLGLVFGFFFVVTIICFLRFRCRLRSFFGCSSLWLFFDEQVCRLDGLRSNFDGTEGLQEAREFGHSGIPLGNVAHCLLEASV